MKKLLLILLCLPIIGFGQSWEQLFGGIDIDIGYSVQQTTDGGYIIAGYTLPILPDTTIDWDDADVYLIKTDGSGIEQWSQTFGGTKYDDGISVQQTTDGGYIIAGTSRSFGDSLGDVYLIKTDGSGNEQWSQTFGGIESDKGYYVQQTSDGGYIITGHTYGDQIIFGNVLSMPEAYLIKTDGNGNVQWTQNFVQGGIAYSVQQTTDGGYIITGIGTEYDTLGSNQAYSYQCFLIKTDGNGNEQWSQFYGGTSTDYAWSVQQTNDGGYIITGSTQSFGNGGRDVYLIKTDANGIEQWTKTFGEVEQDRGYSVQQTTDGGYIIAGMTESIASGYIGVYLIKTDGNGIEQWSKIFGEVNYYAEGNSVQQTIDGGYIIAGSKRANIPGGSWTDVYLIKTDSQGNVTSTFNIPINPNRKLQKTVDLLGKETKPQTNIPFIEIYDDGTVEKRIVIE
jgi:hypothetical protein